jgi:hypothetical protein
MRSGTWGIFYFKEVTKPSIIGKWFLSGTPPSRACAPPAQPVPPSLHSPVPVFFPAAFVTIAGILLLGYESSPAE